MFPFQRRPNYSVAMPEAVDQSLQNSLLRFINKGVRQEELRFALWNPGFGRTRLTALLAQVIEPEDGDLVLSGNVAFSPAYIDRASRLAASKGMGLAVLHSHFTAGWQRMSSDDHQAEMRQAGFTLATTNLPLVGLTLGTDGAWSARFWLQDESFHFLPQWCGDVRVVGRQLRSSFHPKLRPRIETRTEIRYAPALWGEHAHESIMRTHVGVVGLGSVGRVVAEGLARMGVQRVTFIDHDRIEAHNLDRLLGASAGDIGAFKVQKAKEEFEFAATAASATALPVARSVTLPESFDFAADCDVIFSCVDRPLPRHVLNCLSFSHLIPVIDGGIVARFHGHELRGCEWSVRTAGPYRACLECGGSYSASDVDLDRRGLLDDPTYLVGLPRDHAFRHNENVFPLSTAVAAQELMHFIALIARPMGVTYLHEHRWHLSMGLMDANPKHCNPDCLFHRLLASGDSELPRERYLTPSPMTTTRSAT